MPAINSGDQTTLNSFPQGTRLGMTVFRPETIVTAEVSGNPATGAQTITLTNKSETEAPVADMTVYAGSSAGLADGGKARMKSLSGSTLTVAPNFIEWTSYPYITVKKVIEPWAILPDLENDYEDGNKSYGDENLEYHPLGRIGTLGRVAFTDIAEDFWSNSTTVATGASLSTHAWTFPGGSPASSASAGSAASPIAVTWSATTDHTPHYVKYVVTDDNGKSHTRWQPVWVFDSLGDSLCNWTLNSCSGSFDSGSWQASFTVYTDADISEFPEDSMVIIFAEDHYAGHAASIGGNWEHAENIVFGGWIARDTVTRDKDLGFVAFDVLGPVDKMKELLCWPANLEDKSSPDTWHELSRMTCDRAGFHIMTEHTTMHSICDIELTGNTKRMLYVDIPEANPHTQIQDYCLKPIGANLLSDRQGRIYFDLNPNLMPITDRSSIPVVISMDINSPIRNDPGLVLAVEDHSERVSQVDFIAFGYTGEDPKPYYALAPGDQYSTGSVQKVDGIRANSQSEANTLAGLYLANANNIWREVQIPVFDSRIFDIAPQEYTELTLVANDTRRGVEWSAQKLICRHVELEYNHEDNWLTVSPSFEKDSFGPAGITGNYPDTPPQNDGSGVTPWVPALPPTMQANPQDLLIGDLVNGAWWLPVGGLEWVERNAGLGTDKDIEQLGWDPWWFTAEKKASSNPEQAIIWACADGGNVFRSLNLGTDWVLKAPGTDPPNTWGDSPAPTLADLTFVQRSDNIHKNGHHYFIANWDSGGGAWRSWLLMTTDDGESWTWKTLSPVVVDDDGYIYPSLMKIAFGHQSNGVSPGSVLWAESGQGTAVGEADSSFAVTQYYESKGYTAHPPDHRCNIIFDFGTQITGAAKKVCIKGMKNGTITGYFQTFIYANSSAYWDEAYNNYQTGNWSLFSNPLFNIDWLGNAPGANAWYHVLTTRNTDSDNFRYFGLQTNVRTPGFGWTNGAQFLCDTIRVEGTVSIPEIKGIWMDVDSETGDYIYLTLWTGDDELKLEKINTTTLETESSISLGSCTLAELNNNTYYAAPYTPTFNSSRVYVFGRMNAPAGLAGVQHLIQSTDGATTFTSSESGLGTSILTNFRAEGQSDGARVFYGIVSSGSAVPKMYRGIESLAYISDLPLPANGIINVDAFALKIDPDTGVATIGVGNPGTNAVMVVQSEDGGDTWADATLNLPITGEIKTCVFV